MGELVEYLSSRTAPMPVRSLSEDRRRAQLRVARTCYDHLAGVVAVSLADAFVDAEALIRRPWRPASHAFNRRVLRSAGCRLGRERKEASGL